MKQNHKSNTQYVAFIGKGEAKRLNPNSVLNIKGKERRNLFEKRYFIDTLNEEVYEYNREEIEIGQEIVIAKSVHIEGKKQQYEFHKIKAGEIRYEVGDNEIVYANTRFKKSYIVKKLKSFESKALFALYKKRFC